VSGSATRGRELGAAAAVFALAVALVALAALQYRSDPFATVLVADALSYHAWAERVAASGLASAGVFHQAPLHPLLLAAVYAIAPADRHLSAAALLQALLFAAACALLVPLGRLWLDSRRAGVAAALVGLAHAPFVFYALKLFPVPVALATQTLALVALGLARHRPGAASAAAAGAACGLAVLARPEMVLLAPVGLAALPHRPLPEAARAGLAFLVALAAACAPVAIHNARQGDATLVASSAGENLWAGNRPGARGGHAAIDPRAGDLDSQRSMARLIAEQERGRTLRPSEVSAFWRERAVAAILDDPGRWLVLELRKLGRLLHPGDPTDLYSLPLERARYLSVLYALPLGPWSLLLLAAVGLAIARRPAWPLLALPLVHLAVLLVFFVDSRLRVPFYFSLTPFAGIALVAGLDGWRAGRRLAPLGTAVLLAATCVVGFLATRPTPRDVVRLAAVLSLEGRLDAALAVLAPELARSSPAPSVLDQAGWLLQKKGEWARARELYLRALDAGPAPVPARQIRTRLAQIHEKLGEHAAARAQHDAAVRGELPDAGTYYERGMFRLRRGETAGAADDLRQAVRLDPGWPPPREALARLGER
jgi:tetratricopeptide (TPR) repeat protein